MQVLLHISLSGFGLAGHTLRESAVTGQPVLVETFATLLMLPFHIARLTTQPLSTFDNGLQSVYGRRYVAPIKPLETMTSLSLPAREH